jgi:hypothetical protein
MAQTKNHHHGPNGQSQKDIILAYKSDHRLHRAGAREIRAIEAELRRHRGDDHQVSFAYVAQVLRHSGVRVDVDDPFVDPWMDEPYASRLQGVLRFGDLEEAEASLHRLDTLFQEYRAATDRTGTSLVRTLVAKGRQRAESLAANPRVSARKRREKEEVALWFRVWLDVSDLFFDWLELRKQSAEFLRVFGSANGHGKAAEQ